MLYNKENREKDIWNFIKKMIIKCKWYWKIRSKMVHKKIASDFIICVVMLSNFSFPYDCISIIFCILFVALHFLLIESNLLN